MILAVVGLAALGVDPVDFGSPDSHNKLVMGSSMTVIPHKNFTEKINISIIDTRSGFVVF